MNQENQTKNQETKEKIRAVTFLSRDQIDFLDNLGKDVMFCNCHKLSRARILSDLVDVLKEMKIDIKKINFNQETFCQGLLRIINNGHNKNIQIETVIQTENKNA